MVDALIRHCGGVRSHRSHENLPSQEWSLLSRDTHPSVLVGYRAQSQLLLTLDRYAGALHKKFHRLIHHWETKLQLSLAGYALLQHIQLANS